MTKLKEKVPKTQQQGTARGHPEALGSGEQMTLYSRALKELYLIRQLLSRARNVSDFPNIQTDRVRQKEETKENVPNEGIKKSQRET